MKKLVILLGLMLSLNCFARGGGFGGGRSSYSGSRSYSAPARTYSAPITRSAPSTTVVHTTSYHSSNDGFLTGMLLGNAMSNSNRGTPIVVTKGATIQAQQPVVYEQPQSGVGVLGWFFIITIIIGLAFLCWAAFSKDE